MISTTAIQPLAPGSHANLAALAKASAAKVENSKRAKPAAPADTSSSSAVPSIQAPAAALTTQQIFTDAQPPIADLGEAAAATHQASLLIQAHSRVALAAQANASSQSVQRLLQ